MKGCSKTPNYGESVSFGSRKYIIFLKMMYSVFIGVEFTFIQGRLCCDLKTPVRLYHLLPHQS